MTFQEVQMEHWTLGEARQSKVTDAATHYKARGLNHSIVLPEYEYYHEYGHGHQTVQRISLKIRNGRRINQYLGMACSGFQKSKVNVRPIFRSLD